MSKIRISSIYLDLTAPSSTRPGSRPKKIPAHDVSLEIVDDGLRLWDYECSVCGGDYYVPDTSLTHYRLPLRELPHLDEAWDYECSVCGGDYYVPDTSLTHYRLPLRELPHLDEALKAIAAEYAANRTNPVGAFLAPTVSAIEDAIAQRDGSSVYFAAAGDRIKIGWSRKVASRIAQLQTGNPEPVTLLAAIPGGVSKERELHQRFAHARLVGEWFSATPDLAAFIDSLTASTQPG